jgi:hypothetical protein
MNVSIELMEYLRGQQIERCLSVTGMNRVWSLPLLLSLEFIQGSKAMDNSQGLEKLRQTAGKDSKELTQDSESDEEQA